jgi:hypothetical protein
VEVLDEVHRPHPPLPELPLDAVAPGKDGPVCDDLRLLIRQG